MVGLSRYVGSFIQLQNPTVVRSLESHTGWEMSVSRTDKTSTGADLQVFLRPAGQPTLVHDVRAGEEALDRDENEQEEAHPGRFGGYD